MIKYHIIKKNERKLFSHFYLCFLSFIYFCIYIYKIRTQNQNTPNIYYILLYTYNNVMFDELPSIFQKIIFLEKTHDIKR